MRNFYVVLFICVGFGFSAGNCDPVTDPEEDFWKLPKLFHLDDYERCMARKDGLYCLGIFEIYNEAHPNPLYDLIQEKSYHPNLYNHSLLHRGYCLPMRCPSGEQNATARFERCVDAWARSHSLRTRLQELQYCRAPGQPRLLQPDTNDLPHRVFLYLVYALLIMAVVGTAHDCCTEKENRNRLLMCFSIPSNWKHLTTLPPNMDPRLKDLDTINVYKTAGTVSFVLCHIYVLTAGYYLQNPRFMEKLLYSADGFVLGGAVGFTPAYILISNFFTTYNLLLLSEKVDVSPKMYPMLIIKRVIRIYPTYLFLIGFAATWWRSFGDGPLQIAVDGESENCKQKFWISALFLQNVINKKQVCLIQTWVISSELVLYVFTCFVALVLIKNRKHAMKVLSFMCLLAIGLTVYQAFEWKVVPPYMYMTPEAYRTFFVHVDSFYDFYINPSSNFLPAIAGILMAFLHLDHQKRDIKMSRSKFLVFLHYMSYPLTFLYWIMNYKIFRHFEVRTQHLMVVVEKVVSVLLTSLTLYTYINHQGYINSKIKGAGVAFMAKLSFAVSMCHWCICVSVLSNRWSLQEISRLGFTLDIIGVWVLSYIAAVPVTLLVELPLQKFMDRLIMIATQGQTVKIKAQ